MEEKEYDVVMRSVVETHYTVTGTSSYHAELAFHKKVQNKEIVVPGVVQSGPVVSLKADPFSLLPEGYELEIEESHPGAPVFYRVRDTATKVSYRSPILTKAISKVTAFLNQKSAKDPLDS